MERLSLLNKGQICKVLSIDGDSKLKKRLNALGCFEGTEVTVMNKAPFGDPLVIAFRGFSLAIRKKDAGSISVEV